jgi:hypothetical protein
MDPDLLHYWIRSTGDPFKVKFAPNDDIDNFKARIRREIPNAPHQQDMNIYFEERKLEPWEKLLEPPTPGQQQINFVLAFPTNSGLNPFRLEIPRTTSK